MKANRLSVLGFPALALALTSLALAQTKSLSGEIMDAPCAQMGSHEQMMKSENAKNARECTLACAKTQGDLVLYDAANKQVYKLDDQAKARRFAGQKVTVTGDYDDSQKTIHVQSIASAGK